MNGRTAKLIRKTSTAARVKYRTQKKEWLKTPWNRRHIARMAMTQVLMWRA